MLATNQNTIVVRLVSQMRDQDVISVLHIVLTKNFFWQSEEQPYLADLVVEPTVCPRRSRTVRLVDTRSAFGSEFSQ